MTNCTFDLNNKPMSLFKAGTIAVPAFSGLGQHVNKPSSACIFGVGPIPPGTYYIFDRQGGGRLEWFRNMVSDHSDWMALYAADGSIDDETLCDSVKRGNFRLHPKGPRGLSKGCIVIEHPSDYHRIYWMLKGATLKDIPGSKLKAYGQVTVR